MAYFAKFRSLHEIKRHYNGRRNTYKLLQNHCFNFIVIYNLKHAILLNYLKTKLIIRYDSHMICIIRAYSRSNVAEMVRLQ